MKQEGWNKAMRKGTKKIRKVITGTNEYYVYDLDEDVFGKRKRLYGKTEGELKQKIEAAMEEREKNVSAYKPKTKKLSEYIMFYFKNSVGKIAAGDIKRLITLFERAVFGGELDRDIDTISEADIQGFYAALAEKFPRASVCDIDAVLKKTFEISNKDGITALDFDSIKIPTEKTGVITAEYIMTPKEFEDMLSFCVADNCTRYGSNKLIIVFCMMTGINFSALKTLKNSDVDLEKGVFLCEGRSIPMSDRCVSWLRQCVQLDLLPNMGEDVKDAGLLFINSNGVSPSIQSIQYTVNSITKRCGLPKGITGKTLCKSYVVSELEHGTTAEELCQRLGYKTHRRITDIRDEYEVRKILF